VSSSISWNLQMSVREGRLNDARNLTREMVAATEQEPGTQGYPCAFIQSSRTLTKPCALSQSFVIPVCVASVRDRCQ